MTKRKEPQPLKTVEKALEILELLGTVGGDLGVTEIARKLGLPNSNVYRFLSTLQKRGYVEQSRESRKYHLGMKVLEVAGSLMARMDLRRIARPCLEELAHQCQNTVHLAILDNLDGVYVDKIDGPQALYLRSAIGERIPSYCTAIGKVLLAHQPEEIVRQVVARGLKRLTPYTVTDTARLRRDLTAIRRQGYAVNLRQRRIETFGVAAPVQDFSGQTAAAVGIAGPFSQATPEKIKVYVKLCMKTAEEISGRLGYRAVEGRVGAKSFRTTLIEGLRVNGAGLKS